MAKITRIKASDGPSHKEETDEPAITRKKVVVKDKDGNIIKSFGENGTSASFFHTGYWQTWSPDAKYVYYQSGSSDKH